MKNCKRLRLAGRSDSVLVGGSAVTIYERTPVGEITSRSFSKSTHVHQMIFIPHFCLVGNPAKNSSNPRLTFQFIKSRQSPHFQLIKLRRSCQNHIYYFKCSKQSVLKHLRLDALSIQLNLRVVCLN